MHPDSPKIPSRGAEGTGSRVSRVCFLAIAGATALGAPWMLGGETVRTEWWLLCGGVLTLAAGFWVRVYISGSPESAGTWRVMCRALGCGLVFMVLIGVQANNPSHRVILE